MGNFLNPAQTMVACTAQALPAHADTAKPPADAEAGQAFLHSLQSHIAQLSNPAVEMVAALIAVQHGLPQALSDWMLAELSQRADLSQVSPLASATMRIGFSAAMLHTGVECDDSRADFALIRALGRNAALEEARGFLAQLVQKLERFAQPRSSPDG